MVSVSMDAQFKALADGTRREILRVVWTEPKQAGDIAAGFAMSRPAVSRHLRVLREARLVRVEARGTSRFYRADTETLGRLRSHFEGFWDAGLSKLKQVVERDHPQVEGAA